MSRAPFSFRDDPQVPSFDDSKPLFVFDHVCVLCSGGAALLMKLKRAGNVNFTSAQGPLGSALYRHYGIEMDETYLLVTGGEAFARDAGYFRLAQVMGGPWRSMSVLRIVPAPLRRRAYDLIARNRYAWFGKTEACALLTPDQRERLL